MSPKVERPHARLRLLRGEALETRDGASAPPRRSPADRAQVSVVRDFETRGDLNQERVWRIMIDVTRLVCGEATDGFGWSCV